jgi:hypothetical protein
MDAGLGFGAVGKGPLDVGTEAPQQPDLVIGRAAEGKTQSGGVTPEPSSGAAGRRKHVVMEKRTFTPAPPARKRETVIERMRSVVNVRVPVVFLGAGMVGLVVVVAMVYFLGVHRGIREGKTRTLENLKATPAILGSPAPLARGETEMLPAEKVAPLLADKRKAGLNYLVVATYPKAEAERLVAFLKARELEAQATPVHNSALYRVVALRGFDAQGLRSKDYQAFKQRILLIGREWSTSRNKGPSNLSDVWPQRYDG